MNKGGNMETAHKAELETRAERIRFEIKEKGWDLNFRKSQVLKTEDEIEALGILLKKIDDEIGGVYWAIV